VPVRHEACLLNRIYCVTIQSRGKLLPGRVVSFNDQVRRAFPEGSSLNRYFIFIDLSIQKMTTKKYHKLLHEGQYVAEVEVELIVTNTEWAPYLSLQDAYKLDDVRQALRKGDLAIATKLARVFALVPVAA